MNDLPNDFVEALKVAGLTDFFAGCTHAHRQEYLKWIGEAKRAETRRARIEKAMKMLLRMRLEEEARGRDTSSR